MELGFVYMITSPSGRIYIGSTNNISKRFSSYRNLNCKTQTNLLNSFKKYGIENHIFEIICQIELNELLKYEFLIGYYLDVLNPKIGLNCKLPKYKDGYQLVSESTKEKMRFAKLGTHQSDSHKLKLSEVRKGINLGKTHSEEAKMKMQKASKGKPKSEKHKKNMSLSKKGKKMSEETKDKIRKSRIGRTFKK